MIRRIRVVGLIAALLIFLISAQIVAAYSLGEQVCVTASPSLKLRSIYGTTDSRVITYAPTGSSSTIVDINQVYDDGYLWQQVEYNGVRGWMAAIYLQSCGGSSQASSSTSSQVSLPSTGATSNLGSCYVRTPGGTLRVRRTPNGTIFANLANGMRVNTTGHVSGNWTQVVVEGSNGWMSSNYLGNCSGISSTNTVNVSSTVQTNTAQQTSCQGSGIYIQDQGQFSIHTVGLYRSGIGYSWYDVGSAARSFGYLQKQPSPNSNLIYANVYIAHNYTQAGAAIIHLTRSGGTVCINGQMYRAVNLGVIGRWDSILGTMLGATTAVYMKTTYQNGTSDYWIRLDPI